MENSLRTVCFFCILDIVPRTDIQRTPGKRIVTADEEGTLIVWDPRSPTPIFKVTASDARFELDGITSLAVNSSSTLVVVGGVSGGVRVVSLSKGDIVGALDGHKEDESVESVRFIDLTGPGAGSGVVVTGGTDGRACIWDLSTIRLRTTLEHEVSNARHNKLCGALTCKLLHRTR